MSKRAPYAMFVWAALCGTTWAQAPLGPEFQVNQFTYGSQRLPSTAYDAAGSFTVVWQSGGQDGSGYGVFARRYDSAGSPLASEFPVNEYFLGDQTGARIASIGNGDTVAVWASNGQDGSGQGIFGRRLQAFPFPVAAEFRINSYTTSTQGAPSVASDPAGNFVVVWESYRQVGYYFGIFAQRYDARGHPQGLEFPVATSQTGTHKRPDVALDASGNFVVVWHGVNTSGYGIFARRYDVSGSPLGAEFKVSTTGDIERKASVASAADGGFVVVWEDYFLGYLQHHFTVRGRRYDSAGAARGSDFIVNSYTTGWASSPRVTSDSSGNFLVAWQNAASQTDAWNVRGRRYDALGNAGPEFRLNSYTAQEQSGVAVASDPSGSFLALWGSDGQDGEAFGVFGRRFAPDADLIFSDDFEASNLAS